VQVGELAVHVGGGLVEADRLDVGQQPREEVGHRVGWFAVEVEHERAVRLVGVHRAFVGADPSGVACLVQVPRPGDDQVVGFVEHAAGAEVHHQAGGRQGGAGVAGPEVGGDPLGAPHLLLVEFGVVEVLLGGAVGAVDVGLAGGEDRQFVAEAVEVADGAFELTEAGAAEPRVALGLAHRAGDVHGRSPATSRATSRSAHSTARCPFGGELLDGGAADGAGEPVEVFGVAGVRVGCPFDEGGDAVAVGPLGGFGAVAVFVQLVEELFEAVRGWGGRRVVGAAGSSSARPSGGSATAPAPSPAATRAAPAATR
jgi:hypothetical protein